MIGAVINVHDITSLRLAQESPATIEQQIQEAQCIAQLVFREWDVIMVLLFDQLSGMQQEIVKNSSPALVLPAGRGFYTCLYRKTCSNH